MRERRVGLINGQRPTAKSDALTALASARKVLAEGMQEMHIGQLNYLLEYAERKVGEIEELRRARTTKKTTVQT